jgi:hypothetical protein
VHPSNWEDIQRELEVKIVILPPKTTTLLQLMYQRVIDAFKVYYLDQSLQ